MLRVSLRALAEGSVETAAVVEPNDPLLDDVVVDLREPLTVRGSLADSGPGRYYWKGTLETKVAMSCRRCLAPVIEPVVTDVEALFTGEDPGDDPATYKVELESDELILDEMVREELLLAVPEYVVCRDDCRGLCPKCGKDLNEGPCSCVPERDPRWDALRALQRQEPEDER